MPRSILVSSVIPITRHCQRTEREGLDAAECANERKTRTALFRVAFRCHRARQRTQAQCCRADGALDSRPHVPDHWGGAWIDQKIWQASQSARHGCSVNLALCAVDLQQYGNLVTILACRRSAGCLKNQRVWVRAARTLCQLSDRARCVFCGC